MELILISESKLKIMLTSDDMKHFELDANTIDYADTKTRSALRSILNEAKEETGFDSVSDRVFIQIYPSREGGCEMFVTKLLCADDNQGEKGIVPFKKLDATLPREQSDHADHLEYRGDCAYSFDSLEALLALCRRLVIYGSFQKSSAYLDCEKRYYLFLKGYDGVYARESSIAFLDEYGTRENPASVKAYISEYGKCICPSDAIEILSKC